MNEKRGWGGSSISRDTIRKGGCQLIGTKNTIQGGAGTTNYRVTAGDEEEVLPPTDSIPQSISQRAGTNPRGGNISFGNFFYQNCIKMKLDREGAHEDQTTTRIRPCLLGGC